MENKIRTAQLKALEVFSKHTKTFALAGGTALELYYFKHRFSKDLDFFSSRFQLKEVKRLVTVFNQIFNNSMKLENEFILPSRARVLFYTVPVDGSPYPLKLDFVEDLFFDHPNIKRFNRVPVYDSKQIYFQKCLAIGGTIPKEDDIGRVISSGRMAARDVVDLYYLSKNVELLHKFLGTLSSQQQRAMVLWYRTFSRQDFRFEYLDLEVYDKKLDSSQVITHIDSEIKKFMGEKLS